MTREPLLDLAALRADTPGCENVIHFNNAGSGLLARPVLQSMLDHLELEARIGGYEAADARQTEVHGFYASLAELIGCGPENIAFAGSATHAYSNALSSIPFEPGDVVLTSRNDYISNQIAFLALRKRFGVEVVHAPDRRTAPEWTWKGWPRSCGRGAHGSSASRTSPPIRGSSSRWPRSAATAGSSTCCTSSTLASP